MSARALLATKLATAKVKPIATGLTPFKTPANPFSSNVAKLVRRYVPKAGRL